MSEKRIALLLGQAEEQYQAEFIRGVEKQAFRNGYDVCIFSMYIKYQNSAEREFGDSNIYNLVNYDLFDAVIVLSDTIQTPGAENKIEQQIHESLDEMKSLNSVKSFLFSSSGFNTAAKRIAENRPVELVEKQKLEALLSKAGE